MKKSHIYAVSAVVLALFATFFVLDYLANISQPVIKSKQYSYSIVNTYSHDPSAFTEGLFYAEGFLYESTGLYGYSTLREIALDSGVIIKKVDLPSEYFGEGAALVKESIVQLTWQSEIGFVYDKNSFALLGNFTYSTEGWGLTYSGEELIMSNGSDTLLFLNPTSFQVKRQLQILDGNVPVSNLNELEYVKGDIYANVFIQNKIAVIDPLTGQVKAWINLDGLQGDPNHNVESVLNGIAYDPTNDRIFVTGKNWPHLYEIKLIATSKN
jgi:glutaminyl-peptide cyclotransferase